MKKEIKQKFPSWIEEDINYDLCLSDDIDSLFSCLVLEKLKGYKIGWFYNFNSIYRADTYKKGTKIMSVDMDLLNGKKCWGNHVTIENKNAANLNTILNINRNNYYKKFAGSTLLTILSYYNVDLSSCTEEQKMLLLAIDSTYLMYRNPNFKWIGEYWIKDILEFKDLHEVLEKHSQSEFKDIDTKYNLNKGKIYIKNGQLHTNIELDKLQEVFPNLSFNLPKNTYKKIREFKIIESSWQKHEQNEIFSCARTYKNSLRYSIL